LPLTVPLLDVNEIKTEFEVRVVAVGPLEKHPNADTLSLTKVNGYPVIIRTGDFQEGDRAVYIPVEASTETSNDSRFTFLDSRSRRRLSAKKLRGIFSMGLLVPSNPEWEVGEDVAERLGVTKYLTPIERDEANPSSALKGSHKTVRRDPGYMPVFGLDALRKHGDVLEPGELVVVSEKIHGCNARYLFKDGKLHVGSHKSYRGSTRNWITEWFDRMKLHFYTLRGVKHRAHLIQSQGDVWWKMALKLNLKEKLAEYPDYVFYGEIYGDGIQDFTYGLKNEHRFVLFDVYDTKDGRYLHDTDVAILAIRLGLDAVPVLSIGPWDPSMITEFAEGPTKLWHGEGPRHIREGFVVKPLKERWHPRVGRVSLKFASESYLLKQK
jgi:RNA ligase (TIGR02306 family)